MRGLDLLILKAELNLPSDHELAYQLGLKHSALSHYLLQNEIPKCIALASTALAAGFPPYAPKDPIPQWLHDKVSIQSKDTIDWIIRKRDQARLLRPVERSPDRRYRTAASQSA